MHRVSFIPKIEKGEQNPHEVQINMLCLNNIVVYALTLSKHPSTSILFEIAESPEGKGPFDLSSKLLFHPWGKIDDFFKPWTSAVMILREIVGQIIQFVLTFIKLEFITRIIFKLENTVGLRITSSIDAMLNRKEAEN